MKLRFPSTAAIVVLTMTLPAAADVIYSNYLNTTIPLDFDGVTINVGSGSLNPFFGGVGVANNVDLQPFRDGTGGLDTILNFTFGDTLNGSTTTLASPGGFGGSIDHVGSTFTAGTEGYVGFKLNGSNYGWMRVVFTNNTGGAVVKDWAYENSGAAISVGGIRRVGSDVVLSSGFTVGSVINDSGGTTNLLKDSSGSTTTLAAVNTYTGTTSVTAGTLAIASGGSTHASSAVTVSNAGSALVVNGTVNGTLLANASTTLSGTGTVNGAATVNGNLTPGNSGVGLLSFGSSLAMASSTATTMEINGTGLSNHDSIDINGALTYEGALELAIGATFGNGSYTFDLFDITSQSGSFDSMTLTGLYSASLVDNGFGVWEATTNSGNATWTFTQSSGDLSLVVIPEPNVAALIGGIGMLCLFRRRRLS